jgi:uncharacterized repeat protein (TIGR03803 family)
MLSDRTVTDGPTFHRLSRPVNRLETQVLTIDQTSTVPSSGGLHMSSNRNLKIRVLRAVHCALTLGALSSLLLIVGRPAQAQTEAVLYNFTGGSDGLHPQSSLVSDSAGNFYGTTALGGTCPGWNQYGCGVVFELSPNGSGGWKQTVLHTFAAPPDGANPLFSPAIFDKSGNLYGTTQWGGAFNVGTVFELSPVGASWTVNILYSFTGGADGGHPAAGLILDEAGNLYGTGQTGGANAQGTVFKVAPSGAETLLYTFGSQSGDGSYPFAGLVLDQTGNLYGTTLSGGAHDGGTVFKLTPTGTETVLYSFGSQSGDGSNPYAGLVFDKTGNLYGATYSGGTNGGGTVFKLSPTGTETVLYSFGSQSGDGSNPYGGSLVLDNNGNLYGTTVGGGAHGDGTVFKLTPTGTETVLYSFGSQSGDGSKPWAGVVLDEKGNLYGTTQAGGAYGAGVVFEVSLVGAATATTLVSGQNPSIFGQAVTFTASVSSTAGSPTGTVILFDGSTQVGSGTLTKGSVSIVVASLPVGADSMTAEYQGGAGFTSSTSTPLSQTVSLAPTATTLTSSLNPAATNQLVTFTATVTSQYGGAATGSVVFYSGSQSLGTVSLSGNHATLTTSFATAGTYSISAKYNGDPNNAVSTSPTLSQVIIAATTTTLTSSLNPSLVGQAVTFTATVSSTAGTPPNGEIVTFNNGSAVLGVAPLSRGVASFTTSSMLAGIYTITASYAGDANFGSSTSPGLRQVVNLTTKSATATTLVSSLNPSIYGQKVTWTATVTTSGSITPTGKVYFNWDVFSIGAATLNASGVATLTVSTLSADTYPLTAAYLGDANNTTSTSAVLNQVIKEITSTAALTSSPNPSTQGQAVTFTATITSPTVTPTGPVTFMAGKTVLGTAQLSGGKAKFTTSTLPVGSTTVTATYYGDSNITESAASVTQTVQQ